MEEIWRDIKGYEGIYKISDKAIVTNSNGDIIKPWTNNKGYKCIFIPFCYVYKQIILCEIGKLYKK